MRELRLGRIWPVAIVLTSGCALNTPAPAPRQAQFIEGEYAPYANRGSSSIAGQVFLRTRGGEVRYGAGSDVYVNPVTSYSTEWWSRAVVGGRQLQAADPRTGPYQHTARADGEGRFLITGLSAGEYYVVSSVYWEVPNRYGLERTGGNVGRRIRLGDGVRVDLVLDDIDPTVATGEQVGVPQGLVPSPAPPSKAATKPEVSSPPSQPNTAIHPGSDPTVAMPTQAEAARPSSSTSAPAPSKGVSVSSSSVVPQAARSNAEILRDQQMRQAIGDLERLHFISDLQEVRPGILRLTVDSGWSPASSAEYNLKRLMTAYRANLSWVVDSYLELWNAGTKIGEYTEDGLLIGPEYSAPR